MTRSDPADTVVVERTFGAPIQQVWQMWTDPKRFATWYGPVGANVPVCEMHLTEGGVRRICMEFDGPDGPSRMWFTGAFLSIVEPTLLVYTESVSRGDHPPGNDDADTQVRVELSERGATTHVVLRHTGIPAGSPGEIGWQMAFEKLAAVLATHQSA